MIKKIKELFLKKNQKDNIKSLELFFGKNLISENYAKDAFYVSISQIVEIYQESFYLQNNAKRELIGKSAAP